MNIESIESPATALKNHDDYPGRDRPLQLLLVSGVTMPAMPASRRRPRTLREVIDYLEAENRVLREQLGL